MGRVPAHLDGRMSGDLTILVCASLRRETDAALASAGVLGVSVVTVPATCTPTPAERDGLARAVERLVEDRGTCCLVGGGCLHGVELPHRLDRSLVVTRGETCFHLLANRGLVDRWIQRGDHLVTPGWLARWPRALEGWGLDRATAGALFREGARRLLLLDTGVDPGAESRLRELARYLGLPWGVAPVGLDHYQLVLLEAVRSAQAALPASDDAAALRRRVAESAAVFDFVTRLAGGRHEDDVVGRLLEVASSLLAPERLLYCPVDGDAVGPARLRPPEAGPCPELEHELRSLQGDACFSASGRGLLFRVADEHETLGLVAADGLAFPRYLERYLALVRSLARAAAVAVGSARAVARALRAEAAQREARERVQRGLNEALEHVQALQGLLPICSSCKRIRDQDGRWMRLEEYLPERSRAAFSHGVCPDCFVKLYPGYGPP